MDAHVLEMIWRAFAEVYPQWEELVSVVLENNMVFVVPASTSTVKTMGNLQLGGLIVLEPEVKGQPPLFRIDAAGNVSCVNYERSFPVTDIGGFVSWLLEINEKWLKHPDEERANRFYANLGDF